MATPDVEIATGALVTSRAEEAPTSPTVGDLERSEAPPEAPPKDMPEVPEIGGKDAAELDQKSLFDPNAVKRIAALWVLTPTLAMVGSYPLFLLVL